MDKKFIIKYIKCKDLVITKKVKKMKYKNINIAIYNGKAKDTYILPIKKSLIGKIMGEFISTKKTGHTIHDTLKKKKKKNPK